MVERLEEAPGVVHRRGHEVGGRADGHPVIRVVGRKERRRQRHAGEAVGTVLVVLPALVQHHLALGGELLLRQRRQQVAHAVGLEPHGQLQRLGRHHFPVVRAIGVGRAVDERAGLLQGLEIPRRMVRRPLEHQVLEEVREAGASGPFVARADVVPHADSRHRDVMVLVDDDLEAIGERTGGERDVHRGDGHDPIVKTHRAISAVALCCAKAALVGAPARERSTRPGSGRVGVR